MDCILKLVGCLKNLSREKEMMIFSFKMYENILTEKSMTQCFFPLL